MEIAEVQSEKRARSGQCQLWKLHFVNQRLRDGENVCRSSESGPVTRSVPVLVLRRRPGHSPGPGLLTPEVGAGDHPGKDAKTAPHRLSLLGRVRRRLAIGRWSPRQLVHLSAVCRDSSDRRSRNRVCTIATRNKTSHSSAQLFGPLQAIPPGLCAGMRGAISSLFFGPFHAVLGVYRSLSSVTERTES